MISKIQEIFFSLYILPKQIFENWKQKLLQNVTLIFHYIFFSLTRTLFPFPLIFCPSQNWLKLEWKWVILFNLVGLRFEWFLQLGIFVGGFRSKKSLVWWCCFVMGRVGLIYIWRWHRSHRKENPDRERPKEWFGNFSNGNDASLAQIGWQWFISFFLTLSFSGFVNEVGEFGFKNL